MPDSRARKKQRARKFRHPAPLPAPRFSACLYVRLDPRDVAMFRFLLEAEDNLAYMSTVDRWSSVLRVTFSPHQEGAVRRYLETVREKIAFDVVPVPERN
ncbi:conserved hypothetical protein [uncultured delta proteobacterium]|uniref:DUF4911 domain-containing protein n=1 Tax=uncultured delta proteobacterium TaxID=34034 RepID=A0A212KDW4_9DELT|nr:conserved hypothetical protein [uncultured delta proteobacterium]